MNITGAQNLVIEQRKNRVMIIVELDTEAHATEVYQQIQNNARKGSLAIGFETGDVIVEH